MQAAAGVFVERGYDAATMTEIAARAGASIGSLYLFFPTKAALAHAMLTGLADVLSGRLDALRRTVAGQPAGRVSDALFDALSGFLAEHPVYGALIDLPGGDSWRLAVRDRRRSQIAALFAEARPALPGGQPERLAVIVPMLMRATAALSGEAALRDAVLDEARAMLRRHLDRA